MSLGPRSPGGAPLTVELGPGDDAAADAEPVLPVADVEGRHGRVVGHLQAEAALDRPWRGPRAARGLSRGPGEGA